MKNCNREFSIADPSRPADAESYDFLGDHHHGTASSHLKVIPRLCKVIAGSMTPSWSSLKPCSGQPGQRTCHSNTTTIMRTQMERTQGLTPQHSQVLLHSTVKSYSTYSQSDSIWSQSSYFKKFYSLVLLYVIEVLLHIKSDSLHINQTY